MTKFKAPKILPGRTFTVYAVMKNTDMSEGRGTSYPVSFHWAEAGAKFAAKKAGVAGGDADVRSYTVIADSKRALHLVDASDTSFRDVKILEPTEAVLLQESIEKKLAKVKLTDDERKLLGLPSLSA